MNTLASLGPLETIVLEVLWLHGGLAVRDVSEKLVQPLAYTTVMTTLDRLYKKGLLERHKVERAFVYAPRYSRQELDARGAAGLVAGFLSNATSGELLISCLVDAAGELDETLLDELEEKIRLKREELNRSRSQV